MTSQPEITRADIIDHLRYLAFQEQNRRDIMADASWRAIYEARRSAFMEAADAVAGSDVATFRAEVAKQKTMGGLDETVE